jgi:hypothetical protein
MNRRVHVHPQPHQNFLDFLKSLENSKNFPDYKKILETSLILYYFFEVIALRFSNFKLSG